MARAVYFLVTSLLFMSVLPTEPAILTFGISHWNDVSGQIESYKEGTSNSSSAPTPCVKDQTNCIGGLRQLTHWIFDKSSFSNIPDDRLIRLTSGNLIGGESGWIPSKGDKGWEDYASLILDHYKPTAMALGMKEFGAGVPTTIKFLTATGTNSSATLPIAFPANTCRDTGYSGAAKTFCGMAASRIKIVNLPVDSSAGGGTYKIGVIGFLTPTVEQLSLPGTLKFYEVALSVKQEVQDAKKNNNDIKTFIAIGDGNLDTAKDIIDVAGVQLVIYGAGLSNTQNMTSSYPVKHKSGYIVTAGRYGSSVGKLVVDVDTESGNIKNANGAIAKTKYASPWNDAAKNVDETLNAWEAAVKTEKDSTLGYTRVTLKGGEVCWRQECNLGNLMTDAMVFCALNKAVKPYEFPIHSIWHGGAFFEDTVSPKSKISKFDVHKWLPYHNRAHLVSTLGSNLRKVFELSAGGINPTSAGVKDWRQFLQVSNGMEVYYSTKSGKPKLTSIRMSHDYEGVPQLSEIQDGTRYYLVVPTYLKEGRGVFNLTKADNFWGTVSGEDVDPSIGFDDDCLADYIKAMNHVTTGVEERIFIDGTSGGGGSEDDGRFPECSHSSKGHNTAVTVVLTIVFFSIFLAVIYVGIAYVYPRLRRGSSHVEYPRNQD